MTRSNARLDAAWEAGDEPPETELAVALRIRGDSGSWTIPLDLPAGIPQALSRQLGRATTPTKSAFRDRIKPGLARVLVANLDEDLRPPSSYEVHQAARIAVKHQVALPADVLAHRGALRDFVAALKRRER